MMDCFLKCLTILLSVYVSFASAELSEFLWSDNEVSGVYKNEDGSLGIRFVCRPGQLQVETLNNVTLVNFSSFYKVDQRMARSAHILNAEYLKHKRTAHKHLDRSLGETTKPFNETISDLLQMEEITLLEDASRAVGEQGVTGKNTPMALPFHMFALKMTRLLDASSQNAITNEQNEKPAVVISSRQKKQASSDCKKYENYEDCKGLCGIGCNCLQWVCDDCCYHQGCYDHDVCCGIHGYLSPECFDVFSWECDGRYYC